MSFYDIDKREEFLLALLPAEIEPDFAEVRSAAEKTFVPVISKTGAQFLKQITTILSPKKIIEIGTGIGYSGLVMLKNSHASLYTVDFNAKNLDVARGNFERYGYAARVTAILGDASDIVPMLTGGADLIFLDGPKGRYHEYYPYLKNLLGSGGALVCDNVLYSGRITGESETPHTKHTITDRLNLFFGQLKADGEMTTSVLPIGDGISLSVKK